MSGGARAAGLALVWLRRALGLVVAAHLALLLYVLARRLLYPYDLEWMEGGMLVHSLRLMRGEPLYGPPSVDFVPYLYTPLYPAVVALLGKLAGLSYALGRAVSVASLGVVLVLGYRAARREGASRVFALAPAALVAAAFPFCGAWYDVVRNDELYLALVAGGLYLLAYYPRRVGAVLLGGALLGLAFFAKQTAIAFLVAGGVGLLIVRWRALPAYVLSAGAVLAGGIWLCSRGTGGWFWTTIYRLHQNHDFYARRAYLETPVILLKQAPVVLPVLVALFALLLARRRLGRSAFVWLLAAGAGLAIACVGFGTQWAFANAFIPGVVFPALALGVLAGRLTGAAQPEGPARALAAAALALAVTAQLALGFYDPRPYLPTAASRANGARLIARLKAAPGPVFIPDHPFYAVLAGKPAHFHRMGLWDVRRAGLGLPRGLAESIAQQRWALVVMDSRTQWHQWPGLRERYRITATASERDMPHVFSGAGAASEKVRPLLFPQYFMEPVAATPAAPAPVPTGRRGSTRGRRCPAAWARRRRSPGATGAPACRTGGTRAPRRPDASAARRRGRSRASSEARARRGATRSHRPCRPRRTPDHPVATRRSSCRSPTPAAGAAPLPCAHPRSRSPGPSPPPRWRGRRGARRAPGASGPTRAGGAPGGRCARPTVAGRLASSLRAFCRRGSRPGALRDRGAWPDAVLAARPTPPPNATRPRSRADHRAGSRPGRAAGGRRAGAGPGPGRRRHPRASTSGRSPSMRSGRHRGSTRRPTCRGSRRGP
ncbi:MAG TPA: hypothetical protein VGQ83_14320 [Polyangia bacterium]|jgi:hypothetical protein